MSREILKIIAMVTMFLDHYAMVGLADGNWQLFGAIGRIAFPIFAYQIASGFGYTKNRKRYLLTVGIFALISEIPFNLVHGSVIYPFGQNVMFTFFIALLALIVIDKYKIFPFDNVKKLMKNLFLCGLTVAVAYTLGFMTFVDYFGMGVLLVILYYFILHLPEWKFSKVTQIALIGLATAYFSDSLGGMYVIWHGMEIQIQMLSVFSIIPIGLYILTGEKKALTGKKDKWFKYFVYAYYPVHLLFIYSLVAL